MGTEMCSVGSFLEQYRAVGLVRRWRECWDMDNSQEPYLRPGLQCFTHGMYPLTSHVIPIQANSSDIYMIVTGSIRCTCHCA